MIELQICGLPPKDQKVCGNCAHFCLWGVSTGYCPKKKRDKQATQTCNDFEFKTKKIEK
jgi:hypothetical protein